MKQIGKILISFFLYGLIVALLTTASAFIRIVLLDQFDPKWGDKWGNLELALTLSIALTVATAFGHLVCVLIETVVVKRLQGSQYLAITGISALGLSLFVLFNARGITWAAWDFLDKIFGRSIIAPATGWAIVAFGFSAIILLVWLGFQKRS